MIRIAEFKFDLLKTSIYVISMSRSIRTDSDFFSLQNRNAFCLTVCKMKRVLHWGRLLTCVTPLCCGTPGDTSESADEACHSLKCLVPEDFLVEWRQELAALKQIEQPSKGDFHYFMVPPKLGRVVNSRKKTFAREEDRTFLEQIGRRPIYFWRGKYSLGYL